MKKVAIIFGITGQDGSYLAEFLLKKNYVVHGVKRRSSSINTGRIDHIYQDPHLKKRDLILHYGDITDSLLVTRLVKQIKPDEIYNLAAQSHVQVSFESPEYTANADALGALRILEAIRFNNLEKKTKYYQAGTSELYGRNEQTPQNENTNFHPASPYGVAKLYAHWITINYKEAYNIFACNGILFNHESPRRGETFVTQKIVQAMCKIKFKKQKVLYLGNLYAKRDWGHARDYVEAMWLMLKQKKPQDYVIATGKQTTVKNFVNKVAKRLNMKVFWKGNGVNERGVDKNGKTIIACDKAYYRPLEVNSLLGSAKKARKLLNWKPKTNVDMLISEMVQSELNKISYK